MTVLIREIAEDVKLLPRRERSQLVRLLIASLEEEKDDHAGRLWSAEVDRRSEDIRTGKETCRAIGDVVADIRKKLRNARTL